MKMTANMSQLEAARAYRTYLSMSGWSFKIQMLDTVREIPYKELQQRMMPKKEDKYKDVMA